MTLGRCPGGSVDLSLFCPECPDYNIRFEGSADWLRMNYSTWPDFMIYEDHRIPIGDSEYSMLKKRITMKFDNQADFPNKLRRFLIRENALIDADTFASPHVVRQLGVLNQLTEGKRDRAVQALVAPIQHHHLDDLMAERPELDDGKEITIIVPTKYKKHPAK
uniref:Uncharacterized protein n=1 Tax=Bracon brevicornis TaxID=1563983 RepID=A0A6V7LX04_9HYME